MCKECVKGVQKLVKKGKIKASFKGVSRVFQGRLKGAGVSECCFYACLMLV